MVEEGAGLTLMIGPGGARRLPLTHFDRDLFTYFADDEMPDKPPLVSFAVGPDGRARSITVESVNDNGLGDAGAPRGVTRRQAGPFAGPGRCRGWPDARAESRRRRRASRSPARALNRLEHAPQEGSGGAHRYHRIGHDPRAIEDLFVDLFLEAHDKAPARITLDLDATDDPVHGNQEGRFFHGYYDGYCYLPLYVFCGDHLLAAKLRRANIDASAGAVEEIARIVARIRAAWPRVKILLRADSGFAREEIMAWAEANGVEYVSAWRGMPAWSRTSRATSSRPRQRPSAPASPSDASPTSPGRRTTAGADTRRVVAKAEWMPGRGEAGANPRFVVTSLAAAEIDARTLYERVYCARGDMENRIKECQLDLFAEIGVPTQAAAWGGGRTSAATMRANQLRLWFASMAYALLSALRRRALAHTDLARATCGTIRAKLLKIGALVTVSARRVRVAMASACPYTAVFRLAHRRLCG